MSPTITRIARAGDQLARLAAGAATAPIRIGAAVLDSPRIARRDPASAALAQRRHDGWRPREVRLGPRRTSVALERDGETDAVDGTTLAFAAYATRTGVAAGAAVVRDTGR